MNNAQITERIDEHFRPCADWLDFLDYPCHVECEEPIEQAIKIARKAGGGSMNTLALATAIVGAMIDAYRAGVAVEEERMRDALGC